MSTQWYFQDRIAQHDRSEALRAAKNDALAKRLQSNAPSSPARARVVGWLAAQVEAFSLFSRWADRKRSLASQRFSYLENPTPYKNCATC